MCLWPAGPPLPCSSASSTPPEHSPSPPPSPPANEGPGLLRGNGAAQPAADSDSEEEFIPNSFLVKSGSGNLCVAANGEWLLSTYSISSADGHPRGLEGGRRGSSPIGWGSVVVFYIFFCRNDSIVWEEGGKTLIKHLGKHAKCCVGSVRAVWLRWGTSLVPRQRSETSSALKAGAPSLYFFPFFFRFFYPLLCYPCCLWGWQCWGRVPFGLSETCPQGDAGGNAETPERLSTPGEMWQRHLCLALSPRAYRRLSTATSL